MATEKQVNYLAILLNENGIDTHARRKDFISKRFGADKSYTDELTVAQASSLIEELLDMKDKPLR